MTQSPPRCRPVRSDDLQSSPIAGWRARASEGSDATSSPSGAWYLSPGCLSPGGDAQIRTGRDRLRGLAHPDRAREHLCEALRIAGEIGAFLPPLFALPGVALLLADRGEPERAVELYALAARYPFVANSRWFELVFGRHVAVVAGSLPPEAAAALQARGRDRDLWATVDELVAELAQ